MAALKRRQPPPDHWDDVEKLGDIMPMGIYHDTNAKMIAARVPLDYNYNVPESQEWTPYHLVQSCADRNLSVELVIDLTNTDKYYNGYDEFEYHGIHYCKMKVEGFADVPEERIVRRFIDVISKWEMSIRERSQFQGEKTPVVVIHCTHGLNRTGYLIVRYLIATRGHSVKDALGIFTAARPPGLIKHMYVQKLYDMFDQSKEAIMPELPAWAQNKYDRSIQALQSADVFKKNDSDAKSKRVRRDENKRHPPENWFNPPRMGDIVPDTPFLPMRTLLDDSFDHGTDTWTPQVFTAEQALRGYRVRLVIDLTNTSKYYDGPGTFSDPLAIAFKKLSIEGYNYPPLESTVKKFLKYVDDFEATYPGQHIAIHCTHGLNRTGFLVACYLILRKKYTVQAALDAFSLARPPGMIKFSYIDALHKLYGENDPVIYPELPKWAEKKYMKKGRREQRPAAPRKLKLPDHWIEKSPHGSWIAAPNSKILFTPMKTMLDERYEGCESWTMENFSTWSSQNGVHVLVAICERNHFFLNSSLPEGLKVHYIKLKVNSMSYKDQVNLFRALFNQQTEIGCEELRVAVLCSNGVRSAFLISHFMIEMMKIPIDEVNELLTTSWPCTVLTRALMKELIHCEQLRLRKMKLTGGQHQEGNDPKQTPPSLHQSSPSHK